MVEVTQGANFTLFVYTINCMNLFAYGFPEIRYQPLHHSNVNTLPRHQESVEQNGGMT